MSEAIEAEEIPAGFRQTQLGPRTITVPKHWRRVRVKDVSEVVTRGKQPTYVEEPGVPVLNQSCIYWDGYHPENLKYLDEDDAEDWKSKHFAKRGDLLINSTGQGTLGRALYWDKESGTHAIDSHITRVSVDPDTIDPEFLRYYLESTWGQTMLYVFCVAGSTGQIELSKTDLMSMPLLSPPVEEQRRIAGILSTVNKEIQQTTEIIEETKALKRGVMQDLYTRGTERDREMQSTRIGEIPVSWELETIDQHAEVISGTHVKSDLVCDDDSLIPYITGPSDFTRTGIEVSKYTDSPSSFCEKGDVLVTVKGMSCGKSTFADSSVSISRQLKAIRPGGDLDEKYLFYWVRYKEQLLYVLAEGTRQLGLSTSDLTSLPIPIPPSEEQEQIGRILSKIDKKISREIQTKQDLEDLKRGLMQDLLTGKVRVSTD